MNRTIKIPPRHPGRHPGSFHKSYSVVSLGYIWVSKPARPATMKAVAFCLRSDIFFATVVVVLEV